MPRAIRTATSGWSLSVAKLGGLLLRLAGGLVIETGCRRLRIADAVRGRGGFVTIST